MPALTKRVLFLTASTLLIGAISVRLLSLHHAGRGMMTMARVAQLANDARGGRAPDLPLERRRLSEAATWHAKRADFLSLASLGLAALAVCAWAAAQSGLEPGRQGVLVVLLGLYVLLLMLIA